MGRHLTEDGISEVVGFVFILALLVSGLSLYLTYGVPTLGREDEITKMDATRGWFVDYKNGLDRLWMTSPEHANESEPNTNVSVNLPPFNNTVRNVYLTKNLDPGGGKTPGLFARYLPALAPLRSTGTVSVNSTGENIQIVGIREGDSPLSREFQATRISLESNNYYFIQQEYFYQLGGVFLHQGGLTGDGAEGNASAMASPSFSIYTAPGYSGTEQRIPVQVDLVIPSFSHSPISVGSSSPIRIETRLLEPPKRYSLDETMFDPDASEEAYDHLVITVRTHDHAMAEAWNQTLVGAGRRNGFRLNVGPESWGNGSVPDPGTPPNHKAVLTIDRPRNLGGVQIDLLVAKYSLALQNVPTMIE